MGKVALAEWNPTDEFAVDIDEALPIDAPPCPGCIHWNPKRAFEQRKTGLEYAGVILCHSEVMAADFSCFEAPGGRRTKVDQEAPEKKTAKGGRPAKAAPKEADQPRQRRKRRTAEEMIAAGAKLRGKNVPAPEPVKKPGRPSRLEIEAARDEQHAPARVPAKDDRNDPPSLNTRPTVACEHPERKCKTAGCPCVCRPCIDYFNAVNA